MANIISSRRYNPGDLIYKSKPFVRVIRRELWNITCACCLQRQVGLKRCSGCKMVRYCGPTCQKEDWKDHKLECPFLPRYTAGYDHFMVQMIGKLILKTKGKNWKCITDDVMGEKVSFGDLKSHNIQLARLPWFKISLKAIETALKSYLGEENVPNEETLIQLIGKVECNYYNFGEEESETWALFIGASKFDHSCVPNANIHYNGRIIQIRAIKTIAITEKVSICYCPMFCHFDVSTSHLIMKNSFGETGCYCSDCSQPYGLSPLTKILDPVRAIPVIGETEGYLLMASLMSKFKFPMQWFSQERLRHLLKKQERVLGDTNLARIRLLALKCLLLDGNYSEMREELMTLANWVKLAWGENYEELAGIYKKLIGVNMVLNDVESSEYYKVELVRLRSVCIGKEDAQREACNSGRRY